MTERMTDLSWIEPFVRRIRPFVSVRLEDNVLIRMPNECFKLNSTGARLVHSLLNGGSLRTILKERRHDPEAPGQINEFFMALSLMLGHNLCERFYSDSIERVGFELGYIELPILAELAVTDRCNVSCRFCYGACWLSSGGEKASKAAPDELSTDGFKRILEIIRNDAGVPSVSFTGGEPMLRNDIFELIRYAHRSLNMRVNLITNGTLITGPVARRLKKSGLASAQVSIESPDEDVHDALTRVAGSHRRSVAGLKALQAEGVLVHPHGTLNAENADSLQRMPEFVRELGAERFSLNMLIPVGRGREDELAVAYADIGVLLQPVIDASRTAGVEFMWYAPTPLCLFNPVAHGLGNKGCAACEGLLAIDPGGNILPCSSWKEPVGSLLTDDFRSIWSSARAKWLRGKQAAPPECDGCADFAVCHGACPLYFNAFPEDRSGLICRKIYRETEESHGVDHAVAGFSAS
ncbi:radical SAM protein [bacterium]|nr:radical SAM protein [candidate division CSSED10-310 bacterium]